VTSDLNLRQNFNLKLSTNDFKRKNEEINKYRVIAQEYFNDKKFFKCIEYLSEALKVDLQNSTTLSQLGYVYYQLGDLTTAINYFKHSLKNNIDNADALNFWALILIQQGKWFNVTESNYLNVNLKKLTFKKHAQFYLCMIINNILLNKNHLNTQIFKDIVKQYDGNLSTDGWKLTKFVEAWLIFLNKLNNQIVKSNQLNATKHSKIIHHIGDSHCLSFVNQNLKFNKISYKILPKLINGAKAWHLGNEETNLFKKLFVNHLKNIEEGSIVFLSFGEIDCRIDEGIINVFLKNNPKQTMNKIIHNTVRNYVNFCYDHINKRNLSCYIFGIPAPIIIKDDERVDLFKNLIKKFNLYLKNICKEKEINFVDVYAYTKNKMDISNEKYMLDNCHLNFKFIEVIEKLINHNH